MVEQKDDSTIWQFSSLTQMETAVKEAFGSLTSSSVAFHKGLVCTVKSTGIKSFDENVFEIFSKYGELKTTNPVSHMQIIPSDR